MIFSSNIFLYLFLPLTLLVYYLVPIKLRNTVLFISSLIFYAWGEVVYTSLMLASIISNYIISNAIARTHTSKVSKIILGIGISLNLAALFYFKYFNFFLESVGIEITKPITLPLGISFFTFHALSYIIDVYRDKVAPQNNFINLGLYITNFAQLVAGPIIRYPDVKGQLKDRDHSPDNFSSGIKRFIIGMGKKVLIANNVALIADKIFSLPDDDLSTSAAWLGILCYTLQIYYDFSGYSDMAIGLGKMFGFHFLENFNFPYFAHSVQDFWRKWHISLSNWFRDYLYIPLGGNRKGKWRTYLNLLTVFALCGLWHGPSWNFILWGLWHGAFLIFERTSISNHLKNTFLINRLYTLVIVMIGWVIFRCETLMHAGYYLSTLFDYYPAESNPVVGKLDTEVLLAIAAGLLFSIPWQQRWRASRFSSLSARFHLKNLINGAELVFLLGLFFCCIVSLASNTYNPFIYFRF